MVWGCNKGINKTLCQKDTKAILGSYSLVIAFTLLVAVLIILYFVLLIFETDRELAASNPNAQSWLQIWHIFCVSIAIEMMTLVFTILYRYSPCKRFVGAVPEQFSQLRLVDYILVICLVC